MYSSRELFISDTTVIALSATEFVEFISSFAAFANEGYRVNGHLIRRIEDGNGDVIYSYKEEKTQILNKSYVYILNELLSNTYDVTLKSYTSPTCASIAPKLTKKYAIKSGTTDYDLYTIGYNKDVIVSVWTGYDDNRKIKSNKYKYSKNIWADTVESYLKNKNSSWYQIPETVIGVLVDPISGEVADENTSKPTLFYYINMIYWYYYYFIFNF